MGYITAQLLFLIVVRLLILLLQLLVDLLFDFPSLARDDVSSILDAQIGKHGSLTKAWRHDICPSQCNRVWSVFVSKYREAKALQQQQQQQSQQDRQEVHGAASKTA